MADRAVRIGLEILVGIISSDALILHHFALVQDMAIKQICQG
jgi:hypothetical protein